MLSIILKATRHHAAAWGGALAVMAASGFVMSIAFSLLEGGTASGAEGALLGSLGVVVILFAFVSVIVIASTTIEYAVSAQSQGVARFKVVGMSTSHIRRVLRGQMLIVSAVGAIIGHFVAVLWRQPIFEWTYQSLVESGVMAGGPQSFPTLSLSVPSTVLMVLVVVTLALLSARRGLKRATSVSPLAVLREPEPITRRMTWPRWVVSSALLVVLVQAVITIPGMGAEQQSLWITIPLILTSLISALGAVLVPWVVSVVTRLGPVRSSVAWHTARQELLYRPSTTTATVTPVFVIASLTAGLYTATSVLTAFFGGTTASEFPLGAAMLLLGGPALIATVGSIASITTGARERNARIGVLRSLGADRRVVVLSAALQAVFLTATAALLALVVSITTAAAVALGIGFEEPQDAFTLELAEGSVILGVALALLAATYVVQVVAAYSRAESRQLSE